MSGRSHLVVVGLAGVCVILTLAMPGAAAAHAVLQGSEPARGAALERAPQRVVLRFDEAVEGSFGAVRVYDARGERVDSGEVERPASESVAISLRDGIRDGPFTVAYRVVSGDSHPVSGGFVFTVGRSGGTSAASVADLVDRSSAGPVTQVAFGAARAVAYAATALLAGGLLFVMLVWSRALGAVAGGEERWRSASQAFAARASMMARGGALAGGAACVAGIVLQGASASGTSVWSAMNLSVLESVLGTRFGWIWAVRLGAFGVLGMLVWQGAARTWVPTMKPASLGAAGLAPAAPVPPLLVLSILPVSVLLSTPALSGHAGTGGDSLLLVPANVLHVAAMSAWVGGVALLLLALPAATQRLEAPERTRLLAAALARFSPIALAAVAVVVASGVLQSVVHLDSFSDLMDRAFGRAVLVKSGLLIALVALGALNSRRLRPRLDRIAEGEGAPGAVGVTLRRALRAEVGLMVGALVVTAALVSYSPTAGAARGPFSAARDVGPARLEITVEPATVGRNEIHLYFFNRKDGAQYDKARSLRVTASLPGREIGPLRLDARQTGPGHFTIRRADLVPAGDWLLEIGTLVSEFDELTTRVEVPVR